MKLKILIIISYKKKKARGKKYSLPVISKMYVEIPQLPPKWLNQEA